ncbi:hypothetical protein CO662_22970 [Rhizobium anhuiense]|uniref:VOC domain-containing protein n=1 Tax=Rhizobium anhuiense TaxID=1184720 RepID=A0ABX4J4C9_9HYPH|nr:hypothetical protein CO668_30090 [Rhizobium anhuiense]PDS49655.1 hypothetical protein CO662_22970 [Rhizobium anhuiense]
MRSGALIRAKCACGLGTVRRDLAPDKIVDFNRDGALLARFFVIADPDGYKIEVLHRHGRSHAVWPRRVGGMSLC